jgi:hypothetical protein
MINTITFILMTTSPIPLIELFLFETYTPHMLILAWTGTVMNACLLLTLLKFAIEFRKYTDEEIRPRAMRIRGKHTLGVYIASLVVDFVIWVILLFTTHVEVVVCHAGIMCIKVYNCGLISHMNRSFKRKTHTIQNGIQTKGYRN